MSTLFVTEYAAAREGIPIEPAIAIQTVAITTASAVSSAFGAETRYVELRTDAICSVKLGASKGTVTAAATDTRLAANDAKLVAVNNSTDAGARLKVAVISNT